MKSHELERAAARRFQSARSPARAATGVAAVVAVTAFAFLVFGPLADQRVLALTGANGAARPDRAGPGGRGAPGGTAATAPPASAPPSQRIAGGSDRAFAVVEAMRSLP